MLTTSVGSAQPAEEGADEDWRDHSTWRVKEFFDMLKEQYRKLELVCLFPKISSKDRMELTKELDAHWYMEC